MHRIRATREELWPLIEQPLRERDWPALFRLGIVVGCDAFRDDLRDIVGARGVGWDRLGVWLIETLDNDGLVFEVPPAVEGTTLVEDMAIGAGITARYAFSHPGTVEEQRAWKDMMAYVSGDPVLLVYVGCRIALVTHSLGDHDEGADFLQEASDALEELWRRWPSALNATMLEMWSDLSRALRDSSYDGAQQAIQRAVELGRRLVAADPERWSEHQAMLAINGVAIANEHLDWSKSETLFEEGLAAAERLGETRGPQLRCDLFINRLSFLSSAYRWDAAIELAQRLMVDMRLSEPSSDYDESESKLFACRHLQRAFIRTSRLEDAWRVADWAVIHQKSLATHIGPRANTDVALAYLELADCRARCGDFEEAISICEQWGKPLLDREVEARQAATAVRLFGRWGRLLSIGGGPSRQALSDLVFLRSLQFAGAFVQHPKTGVRWEIPEAMQYWADSHLKCGRATDAIGCLQFSKPFVEGGADSPGWLVEQCLATTAINAECHLHLGEFEDARTIIDVGAEIARQIADLEPLAQLGERARILYLRARLLVKEEGASGMKAALESLRSARECCVLQLRSINDPFLRRRTDQQFSKVGELEIECRIANHLAGNGNDDLSVAYESSEEQRMVQLRQHLGEQLPKRDQIDEEDRQRYAAARQRRRAGALAAIHSAKETAIEGAEPTSEMKAWRRERFLTAQREEREAAADIRRKGVDVEPDWVTKPPALEELARRFTHPERAAIYYILNVERAYAVTIARGRAEATELPDFSADRCLELANRWATACPGSEGCQAEADHAEIQAVLAELSLAILDPLLAKLPPGVQDLTIIPHRALHTLPLHACPVGEGKRLVDRYAVSYAPSGSILALDRERPGQGADALILDIDEKGRRPLACRPIEVEVVSKRMSRMRPTRITTGEGVIQESLRGMGRSKWVHMSGHAFYKPGRPMDSFLQLGRDHEESRRLTLEMAYTRLDGTRIEQVFLSACETGKLSVDPLDDHISFAGAMLFTGAQSVISTHWKVSDLASLLLSDRYYAWRVRGSTPGSSLRESQNWLRGAPDSRGFCLRSWSDVQRHVERSGYTELVDARKAERFLTAFADHPGSKNEGPPFASPVYWAAHYVACRG